MKTEPCDRWLRRFHESPSGRLRLICFPHVGGSATYFFSLSRLLGPTIDVIGVQYSGRQDRRHESPVDNIPELADRVFDAVCDDAGAPFAFFGHSMGAIVAFEVACRCVAAGLIPERLFVSGRNAPSRHRPGTVHLRDGAGILAELRRLGGTNELFLTDEELRDSLLRTVRSDYRAVETYRWTEGPALPCPITTLIGDADPHTNVEDASAWAEHTTADAELHVFPGGHFYLEAQSSAVIARITSALA